MSALASAMKSGLKSQQDILADSAEKDATQSAPTPPLRTSSKDITLASEDTTAPAPDLPLKPRPATMIELGTAMVQDPIQMRPPPVTEKPRPETIATIHQAPVPILAMNSRSLSGNDHITKSLSPSSMLNPSNPSSPLPPPRQTLHHPFVQSNENTQRSNSTKEQTVHSDSESEMPMTKEERARHELAKHAIRGGGASSPNKLSSNMSMFPSGPALHFKRKENSTSGDDKALEKVSSYLCSVH
jgi:hypothetical protein